MNAKEQSVAGTWTLTVEQRIGLALVLGQRDATVTGTLDWPHGDPIKLSGRLAGDTLTFSGDTSGENFTLHIDSTGSLKDDGTLAGTLKARFTDFNEYATKPSERQIRRSRGPRRADFTTSCSSLGSWIRVPITTPRGACRLRCFFSVAETTKNAARRPVMGPSDYPANYPDQRLAAHLCSKCSGMATEPIVVTASLSRAARDP